MVFKDGSVQPTQHNGEVVKKGWFQKKGSEF